MTYILHIVTSLNIFIFSAMAATSCESNLAQLPCIKELFWKDPLLNTNKTILSRVNPNYTECWELYICKNYKTFGESSFWQYLPRKQNTVDVHLSQGFKTTDPDKKIYNFKIALDNAYNDLSYTIATLCLAEAYVKNEEYINALVTYRFFEKSARPIVSHYKEPFRKAIMDEKLVEAWRSQNPHLIKKLESAKKLYKEELKEKNP